MDIDFINNNFDALIENMYKFGINTPKRIKYFLAQCYHETGGFKHFKENLNYSVNGLLTVYRKYFNESNVKEYARKPVKIANYVYDKRYGNTKPGDGSKYIGRGLIQITFYNNYKEVGKRIGVDIINHPELVSDDPRVAIASACAFFQWKGLNKLADNEDMIKITKKIQGSLSTLNERIGALNKIINSPKLQQICNSMEKYIQDKKYSDNSPLPSNLFPLDNKDIYIKALKNNIKYEKEGRYNNSSPNTASKTDSSSSSLFSLDNKDIYIKALKEQIKYIKDKEKEKEKKKDSDEDSDSPISSSNIFPPNKPKKRGNTPNSNNNEPPHPPGFQSKNKQNNTKELGGIDFSNINEIITNARKIKFRGLVDSDCLLLFNKKINKSSNHSIFINLEDIAVILKILYDDTIKNKAISFSLDPKEPTNPYGPTMRKVFYPDEFEKKEILKGTKIGEDMFLADYLLKQMSLGYKSNQTKFKYPHELERKGLKPIEHSKESNGKFNRLWVVTKKIEIISKKSGFFYVNDIKLGVDAREMEISQNGILIDKKNQNLNSPCYKFAELFSNLFDDIAKYYPIFDRLKEIAGAIAVAQYIYDNQYPIDYNLIEEIYKSTLIPNYQFIINSIFHYDEKIYENNRTLSLEESVEHYLAENNMLMNQYNYNMAKNHIINNNIKYTLKRKNSLVKSVFGGIDLWKGLIENKCNILNESINSISTIDDEDSYTKIISVKENKLNVDLTDCDVFEFPFLIRNKKCSICNIDLNLSELKFNEINKNMYKSLNTRYCFEHNPFKCMKCNELITGKYITINEKYYHSECMKCIYCYKKLVDNICEYDEGFIHKKCLENYKNDIMEKELKYLYENCPNCEFCDEKITAEYNVINNYKIHKKCLEKIQKKGVDPGKKYIIEGITNKCYICKKIIFGDYLNTINGVCHGECLSFIMFIIYAFFDTINKDRYNEY